MAKVVLCAVAAVYYTGVEYTERAIPGGLKMEEDTVYILGEVAAKRLLNKGIVTLADIGDLEVDIDTTDAILVDEVPSILALSKGAHAAGAKSKEADMAAYRAVTADETKEPAVDGEGLTLDGGEVLVEEDIKDL